MPKHLHPSPFYLISLLLLTSCNQLDNIEYSPIINPELFLQNQHWIKIQFAGFSFIWSQPTSTIIVYFVGLFAIYTGYQFIANIQNQQSKWWWAIGLILTGIGALFAGTSYQAFGYEIKCNGRAFCTYTSWWEVIYLLLSVLGMNAFLIATGYSNTKVRFRKSIIAYAFLNTVVYFLLMFYGIFFSVQFLVSFECLVAVSAPTVLFLLFLHALAYKKAPNVMDLSLLYSWLMLIAVGVAYTVYLSLNLSGILWQKGIWFTENDVLHVGMICWVFYVLKQLPKVARDLV